MIINALGARSRRGFSRRSRRKCCGQPHVYSSGPRYVGSTMQSQGLVRESVMLTESDAEFMIGARRADTH